MGLGVHITLFHTFPYPGQHQAVLDGFATGFLILNILLFLAMTAATIMRYWMYPAIWNQMLNHPVQSLYVGCYPMALATIINGLTIEAHQRYHIAGTGFLYFIWGLWWIDLALSLTCSLGMFYIMITRHKQDTSTTFSIWLLPIVPNIVAGTSGCIVAKALAPVNQHLSFLTTLVSACGLALGLTMSLPILVLYIQRLILHGFPAKGTSISVFLPLGPLGQGGYGLILVGNLLVDLLPHATSQSDYLATPGISDALSAVLFLFSVTLWVFGIWFLIPAVLLLMRSRGIPFGVHWWGLIFPSGVYAVLTLGLAQKLHSSFLNIIGTIYTASVFIMFTAIATRTILSMREGSMFSAPCLSEYVATKADDE
ncbi:Plasma membrane sulfite pump involved in sulfite metabolism [Tulasnella sp. JGI-2019a]|nr:Plasma membrane sulfite pump involved in sulfite metabolism [Tulasnella sp. JGI-2019a]